MSESGKSGLGQINKHLAKELEDAYRELDTFTAHLRAIAANPDDNWTGWRAAVKALIPGEPEYVRAAAQRLREMSDAPQVQFLADRLDAIADEDAR